MPFQKLPKCKVGVANGWMNGVSTEIVFINWPTPSSFEASSHFYKSLQESKRAYKSLQESTRAYKSLQEFTRV